MGEWIERAKELDYNKHYGKSIIAMALIERIKEIKNSRGGRR